MTYRRFHRPITSFYSFFKAEPQHPSKYLSNPGYFHAGVGVGSYLTPSTEVALMSRCSDFVTWCRDGRPSTLLGPKLAWSRQLRLGLESVRSIRSFLIFDHPVLDIIGVQSITITSFFLSSIIRIFKFYFVLFIFPFFLLCFMNWFKESFFVIFYIFFF